MDFKIFIVILSLTRVCFSEDPFELGEFLTNEISSIGWNATWISGNALIYTGEQGDIIQHTFNPTGSDVPVVIIKGESLQPYNGATLDFSFDNKFALVKYDVKSIFRHSVTAKYAIFDMETRTFADIAAKEYLQICSWSPSTNSLVYVLNNNVYYVPNAKTPAPIVDEPLTTDGKPGEIYNGVPDWVYEEEVFGTGTAMWFSPDAQYLVYAKFIDTDVDSFTYFKYGEPGTLESQYPEVIDIKYPKVGRRNPTFEVYCVKLSDAASRAPQKLDFMPAGTESQNLVLKDIIWASNKDVIVYFYTNREQTGMYWKRCDVVAGSICTVEHEDFTDHGWINIGSPIYKDDGKTAIFITPVKIGEDSYPQIVEFESRNGLFTNRTAREDVKYTITKIHGWHKATDAVYYEGTAVGKHSQKHVYSAVLNEDVVEEKCLTCDLETPEGKCTYATASFSKDLSYYSLICQGPGPTETSIHRMGNANTQIWEKNLLVRSKLSRKMKPVIEDYTFTFKDDLDQDYDVRVRLVLPPQLRKSEDTKYPMIVNVYGGPDSNQISDAFTAGFSNYATTSAKYIYAYIDGRGSGLNGDNNMYSIFRKLGTVEIQDQIRATRKLQNDNSWVDSARTCIWGWSYGGFAAAWTLAQDVGDENYIPVFACGLAVAPVTSFIYYDSIYTERYMGLPTVEDNKIGYDNTDLTAKVENLKNKKFFLIHGNADDNVHYQQSMMLARALELKDVDFQAMSYPDENHGLRGVYPHLYHIIDKFFRDTFHVTSDYNGSVTLTKSPLLLSLSVLIFAWFYSLK